MEDKLNQLKEEYCKWKCKYKYNRYSFSKWYPLRCHDEGCDYCFNLYICNKKYLNVCSVCKVNDFVRYIRDEL